MTTLPDPYASRTGPGTALGARVDPVVWVDDTPGPLSPDQVAQFDRDGFLVLPDHVDALTVDALRHATQQLETQPDGWGVWHTVREPHSPDVRSMFGVHRTHEVFRALVRTPALHDAAAQILGRPLHVFQSRINVKRPGGKGFRWHSDFETWHTEDGMPRPRALSASVLLTPSTAANGALQLVPGSHRHYIRCPGPTPPDHYRTSLKRQEVGVPDDTVVDGLVDELGITPVHADPGAVVLFDSNVLHGSAPNTSDMSRTHLFFVYNHVDNAPDRPTDAARPRPGFLAERPPVPLSRS